jgi:hypothetical protein
MEKSKKVKVEKVKKPKRPGMIHLCFTEGIKEKLKPFAAKRSKSMNAIVEHALTQLFIQEEEDPKRLEVLERIISRNFLVPKGVTTRIFFLWLHHAATVHGKYSAKREWGDVIYLSQIDKTNEQTFLELKDEFQRELKR